MLDFVEEEFNIFPLLVYPCMLRNDRNAFVKVTKNESSSKSNNKNYNLNLGIYGIPPKLLLEQQQNDNNKIYPMITKVRKLEAKLRLVGGFQHTYCDSFQSATEFSEMFDISGLYRTMRTKYHCDGVFPTVYEKTRPEMEHIWQWLKEEEKDE